MNTPWEQVEIPVFMDTLRLRRTGLLILKRERRFKTSCIVASTTRGDPLGHFRPETKQVRLSTQGAFKKLLELRLDNLS